VISVIVPTYNEERNIEGCLRSLESQTLPRESFEIIIVDGQSKDRTVEIAEAYADKVIQQVSRGVGGARNDGVMVASGKIIVTTDADCHLPSDWLESIRDSFEDPKNIAATGLLRPEIAGLPDIERAAYKIFFEMSNVFLLIAGRLRVYHLCGANSAFRRSAFMKAGGYTDLPYADDVEIVKRLSKMGKITLSDRINIGYSVRRIRKVGLIKYTLMIFRNDWAVMFFHYHPKKSDYAKQNYG